MRAETDPPSCAVSMRSSHVVVCHQMFGGEEWSHRVTDEPDVGIWVHVRDVVVQILGFSYLFQGLPSPSAVSS